MKLNKILSRFIPQSGKHCVTCSVRQIFMYNGFPFSEDMLFGLASGLGFYYMDEDVSDVPLLNGRIRIGDIEDNLGELLNIKIDFHQENNINEAYFRLREAIIDDKPAMVYVDMHYLKYLKLTGDYHFGGHTIVVYGIDEINNKAYISDTDSKGFDISLAKHGFPSDFHLLPLDELERARDSDHMPFPANNKMLVFDFSAMEELTATHIYKAIYHNMDDFLGSKYIFTGINGIRYFAERIVNWDNYNKKKFREYSFDAFLVINQVSGNGGGGFRKMYSGFLNEASAFAGDPELKKFSAIYHDLSNKWDEIANCFYKLSYSKTNELLTEVRDKLVDIAGEEEETARSLHQYTATRLK